MAGFNSKAYVQPQSKLQLAPFRAVVALVAASTVSAQVSVVCHWVGWLAEPGCFPKAVGDNVPALLAATPEGGLLGNLGGLVSECGLAVEFSQDSPNTRPCKADAPEGCSTFFEAPDERCLPATSAFDDADDWDFVSTQAANCLVELTGPLEANSTECEEKRETYYTKLGCPECIEFATAEANALGACSAITAEADCTLEASGAAIDGQTSLDAGAETGEAVASHAGAQLYEYAHVMLLGLPVLVAPLLLDFV